MDKYQHKACKKHQLTRAFSERKAEVPQGSSQSSAPFVWATWASGGGRFWRMLYMLQLTGMENSLGRCGLKLAFYINTYTCISNCKLSVDWTSESVEPPHDKTNKMACVPSEDRDQLGHSPSLISLPSMLNR